MLEVETIVYCSSNSEPFLVQFKKENSILKAIDLFELENKTSGGNYSVENSTIEGNVQTEKRYPGCPFCENPAFYQCPEMNGSAILAGTIIEPVIDFVGEKTGQCGQLSCHDGQSNTGCCGNCGHRAKITTDIDSVAGHSGSGENNQSNDSSTKLQKTDE